MSIFVTFLTLFCGRPNNMRLVIGSFLFHLVLCVFISLPLVGGEIKKCHRRHPDFHMHLGTKTPYRIIANYEDRPIHYNGCHPVRIFGIVRHGTRTPGRKFIDKMKHLNHLQNFDDYPKDNDGLCTDEAKYIKKWNPSTKFEGEKFLTHEGEDEMIELAERFQSRFPSLMTTDYSNTTYFFRYTDTQRTRESAKYFTIGLFGRKVSNYVWFPQPVYGDPILRFYKLCERWRKEVKKNPDAKEELKKYINHHREVMDTCMSVSRRFGLNYTLDYETKESQDLLFMCNKELKVISVHLYTFTMNFENIFEPSDFWVSGVDEVQLMYTTCGYETAWNKKKMSPWCSVFSKSDLKVMEYAEDLKYYWIDGYGYNINHQQACPAIQDIFSHLRNGTKAPVVFYFTHSGTLLKLISHVGLYKDDFKLNHDTQSALREQRQWRVSQIDSFGTNLVFVLYNCSGESKVLTMHQERIVALPGCPKNEPCPIVHLENTYKTSIDGCNFGNMCSVSD